MSISFNYKGSALLRGFESRNRDWEPKNRIFVYNAEALALISSNFNSGVNKTLENERVKGLNEVSLDRTYLGFITNPKKRPSQGPERSVP